MATDFNITVIYNVDIKILGAGQAIDCSGYIEELRRRYWFGICI